jgi:hypothetical protein
MALKRSARKRGPIQSLPDSGPTGGAALEPVTPFQRLFESTLWTHEVMPFLCAPKQLVRLGLVSKAFSRCASEYVPKAFISDQSRLSAPFAS